MSGKSASNGNEYTPVFQYPPVPIDILHSKHVPSEAEVDQMKTFLEGEEVQLEKCVEDLGRLRNVVETLELEKLESEKHTLEKQIMERRSVLSVSRRLPIEIWNEIFSLVRFGNTDYSLSTRTHLGRFVGAESHAVPLRLSQVCSHWRSVVQVSPRLWASISFDIYGVNDPVVRLLETFLARSGNQPLRLRILDTRDPDYVGSESESDIMVGPGSPEVSIRAFRLLMAEMYRCEELQLRLGTWKVLNQLSEPPNFSFNSLHRLSINMMLAAAYPFEETARWLWRAIRASPNLTDFNFIHNLDEDEIISAVESFPFHQFTSLLIGDVYETSSLLPFLSSCTNLESLTIKRFKLNHIDETALNEGTVLLQSLSTFSIISDRYSHPSCLDHLLCSLAMPQLTTLKVDFLPDHRVRHNALENWPSQDFLTTAGQWSSTLSKLSIHLAAAYISDQGMSELLASLPNLEHLVVGLEGRAAPNVSSTSFVEKLAITDSDIMVVLPKLRKFTLTLSGIGVPTRMEKVEEFLRMAETRCRERIQNGTVVASLMTSRVTYFCSTQYHTMKSNDLTHKLGLDVIQRLSALEEVGAKCIIEGDINTTSSLL